MSVLRVSEVTVYCDSACCDSALRVSEVTARCDSASCDLACLQSAD
jgi:hypothetical protein